MADRPLYQAALPGVPDPREEAWERFPNDAFAIEQTATIRRCRSHLCQAPVWLGATKGGSRAVFDVKPTGERTGTNHWRTCLDRQAFKKR